MTDEPSTLPPDRLWQPVTGKWFWGVFGPALAYGIIRYHIAQDVAWAHFPLFILNKTTSLAAVIFVSCSYLVGRVIKWHNDDPQLRLVVIKFCGLMGFSLAAIHAFFSVCLLRPEYYPGYFAGDGRMNLVGELGMACGVVGLWALSMPAITTLPMMPKAIGGKRWKRIQRFGYVALGLVIAHLVVFGIRGWLAPGHWPSGLPPISLVATAVAIVPVIVRFYSLFSRQR